MGGAGSSTTERREKGGITSEYLAYLGLLVVAVVLGFARREVADLNAESAADQKVGEGIRALNDEGNPKRAVQILAEAVKAAPEHFNAHLHLALALESLHDDQAAREVWLKILEMAEVRRDSSMLRLARGRLDRSARPSAALPSQYPAAP